MYCFAKLELQCPRTLIFDHKAQQLAMMMMYGNLVKRIYTDRFFIMGYNYSVGPVYFINEKSKRMNHHNTTIIITLVVVLTIIILIIIISNWKKEGFEVPYASVVHIAPDVVPLALDGLRGPDSSDLKALSILSKHNGLRIHDDGPSDKGLTISDAAILAHASDSNGDFELPQLVAPLQAKRSLYLLSPFDPDEGGRPDFPPSLGQLIESNTSIRVLCSSGLESSLFEVAWAVAGGEGSAFEIRIVKGGPLAVATAAWETHRNSFVIVPVWACPGSHALSLVLNAWPSGHVGSISYHPADAAQDGFLIESAPHVIKARAPALTAEPVPTVGNAASRMQMSLVAPSLVVLYGNGHDESTILMADAISDALLLKDRADPESTIAMCTFYKAHGIPLLPRTEETTRAFDLKRQSVAFQSPYSRSSVTITEQFSPSVPAVELVPTGPVRLEIRWDKYAAEAKLVPHGTASVDGVRLRTGDRLILENQEDDAENGSWVVVNTVGGIPVLQKPVALDPDSGYKTKLERSIKKSPILESGWQWRFTLPTRSAPASLLREGDQVAWLPLPGAPIGTVTSVGGEVVEIVVPDSSVVASPEASKLESEWFNPLSRCLDVDAVGHTLDTRQQCETKGAYTWDRPCTIDAECPYFQNGTENPRGKCLPSGRCEAPVGVKPFAYRKIASAEGILCSCDGKQLSLRAASKECCDLPGARPVFALETV